ncbi:hypothetical protein LBW89_18205 [Paenibacillus sp. alder61]|uniref:SMI1/KNR4 family protein n=1 Tax=Paenibacillus faecis TaxID=862114 RepID=A0A5D0CM95_9BACL|nr:MULTISPECIES: hypothetical protein [Paenibacillus]MCA1294950.1 hypothetical protein [Paenibacillus sp. alder61]TYA10782.1 hypothetical protein FRY98_23680 [Paenibacillus faecis]
MNESLKRNINKLKTQLASNPDSILIGQIHDGNPQPEMEDKNGALAEYTQFLQECDGASFGEIILFPVRELSRNQFYVETLAGGTETWLFIGHILYEPLVINKTDGKVYMFYGDEPVDWPEECFGSFDHFLMDYAFGKKYLDLVPVDLEDGWVRLIRELDGWTTRLPY